MISQENALDTHETIRQIAQKTGISETSVHRFVNCNASGRRESTHHGCKQFDQKVIEM